MNPHNGTYQWSVTVNHGDDLDAADFTALQIVRRTLLALLGHGFITELNTYSGPDLTVWSYRQGTEDGDGIKAGLLDTLRAIAPEDWVVNA